MFEQFNEKAVVAIRIAQQEAFNLGQAYVGTELLLVGLIAQGDTLANRILKDFGVTFLTVHEEVEKVLTSTKRPWVTEVFFTVEIQEIFTQAIRESQKLDHDFVGPEHLLLAMANDEKTQGATVLRDLGVDLETLRQEVIQSLKERMPVRVGREESLNGADLEDPDFRDSSLEQFVTDLTELAATGQLDPVIGRNQEIERVIQILGRRNKNNAVLVGEPGVGKTAIAEGLAQRITQYDVPELLAEKRVLRLDMGSLVAGTRFRGEFEERLKQVVAAVQQAGNIILFIDEIHTLVGAGVMEGGMDAANLLKPALARGTLQCLGATTLKEYRQYIESDPALERRFQPVTVSEPSPEDTLDILLGIRERYEDYHRLIITDEALQAAVTLSTRYIPDRYLPDKAIDLIDEAGSRVRLHHSQKSSTKALKEQLQEVTLKKTAAVQAQDFVQASHWRDQELLLQHQLHQLHAGTKSLESSAIQVTAEDVAQVLSAWVGIPVAQLTHSEAKELVNLEASLHQRVIGQKTAVKSVAQAIRRARLGLRDPQRPIASFIFCGPTGVGKTELARALSQILFGSEDALIRLDMSEYMEAQSVAKLVGSPPGYVGYGDGGQLTEAIRRKPYAVILLDEIEKAHPDVFNLLLQVLEDGRLTDAEGRTVNFKNTLVIMTSNLGSGSLEKGRFGLADTLKSREEGYLQEQVQAALQMTFRPEFMNRLDEVIVFHPLTSEEVKQIITLLLQPIQARLSEQNLNLELTPAFQDRLMQEGYDPKYGARALRRAITRWVEDPLAEALLLRQIGSLDGYGDTVILDIGEDTQVKVRQIPAHVTVSQ
jgi:ATP-dependent Clp protease ATP-binding subunit ClpC